MVDTISITHFLNALVLIIMNMTFNDEVEIKINPFLQPDCLSNQRVPGGEVYESDRVPSIFGRSPKLRNCEQHAFLIPLSKKFKTIMNSFLPANLPTGLVSEEKMEDPSIMSFHRVST